MCNQFQVGDLDVLVVSDGEISFPAHAYFPASSEELWKAHDRWRNHDGTLTFPYSCFLVRSGDRRILIDTGVGPVVTGIFKGGELLGKLAASGVRPEDIDAVFVTHLHVDHCGTAAIEVDGEMRPTFPNATYHWTSTRGGALVGAAAGSRRRGTTSSTRSGRGSSRRSTATRSRPASASSRCRVTRRDRLG